MPILQKPASAARLLIYWPHSSCILTSFIISICCFSLAFAESPLATEPEPTLGSGEEAAEPYLPTDAIRDAIDRQDYSLAYELQNDLLERIGDRISSESFGDVVSLYEIRRDFPYLGDPVGVLYPFERFDLPNLPANDIAQLSYMYFNENMPQIGEELFLTYLDRDSASDFSPVFDAALSVLDGQSVIPVPNLEETGSEWLGRLLVYPSQAFSDFPLYDISQGINTATETQIHYSRLDEFFLASAEGRGTEIQASTFRENDLELFDFSGFFGPQLVGTDEPSYSFVRRYQEDSLRCLDFVSPDFYLWYEPVNTLRSQNVELEGGTQVQFIFSDQDENFAFLVFNDHLTATYTCMNISGSSILFRDLNGDGEPEAILQFTFGSSGELSALIFSRDFQQFWVLPAADHGSLELIDLDGDSIDEILVRGWNVNRRFRDCNQCPARVHLNLFEYGEDGVLRQKSAIMGAAEVSTGANQNLFGISQNVSYFAGERFEHTGLLDEILQLLAEGDESRAEMAFNRFLDQVEGLQDVGRLLDAQEALERVNHNEDVLTRFPDLWLHSTFLLCRLQLSNANFEELSFTARETLDRIEDMESELARQARQTFENIDLISSIVLGEFEHAEGLVSRLSIEELDASTAGNVALLYNRLAAWELAEDQALIALERSFQSGQSFRMSVNSMHLAEALYEMGREDEAINWLFRAISSGRTGTSGGALFEQLMLAAEIALDRNEVHLARAFLAEALTQVSSTQWNTSAARYFTLLSLTESSKGNRFEYLNLAIEHSRERNHRDFASAKYFESLELLTIGEREQAIRSLFEAFDAVQRRRIDIGSTSFKLSHLVDSERIYFALSRNLYLSGQLERLFDVSDDWKLQAFLDELSDRDRTTLVESGFDRALTASVEANTTIVSFVEIENRTLAFVFDRGSYKVVELETDNASMSDLVEEITQIFDISVDVSRSRIQQDRISSSELTLLREGYDRLIDPLNLDFASGLYIVPSDGLVSLPWSALAPPPSLGGQLSELLWGQSAYLPLAERTSVAIVPSIALIEFGAVAGIKDALVFHSGGPFQLSIEPYELDELLAAYDEADLIAQAYQSVNGSTKVLGPTELSHMTSGELQRKLENQQPQIIHFAAHGVFSEHRPLESFLVLGQQHSPYLLRGSEIANWRSPGLSLVTIAACQSGAQNIEVGGEFFGLIRAFFLAGAETVVASPWLVPDEAASLFFVEFHRQVAAGSSVELAFTAGQNAVRSEYNHPFYWASFYMTTLSI